MTKIEVAKLMTVLQANYPDTSREQSDEALSAKVELWHSFFADYPSQVVSAAARSFIATDTKGFMPNVGQIMAQIQRLTRPDEMTSGEAWGYVAAALRNSTYGAAEEFSKLPPEIQRAVGDPAQLREWALMDAQTVQSVVASNFQRSFRVQQERAKDMEKLPNDVRRFITRFASDHIGLLETDTPKEVSP